MKQWGSSNDYHAQVDQALLSALEASSGAAIGGTDWAEGMDGELLANLGRYRKYNSASLRDLLRVIRNKHNHFRELPEELQEKMGPLPQGYLRCASVCTDVQGSWHVADVTAPTRLQRQGRRTLCMPTP